MAPLVVLGGGWVGSAVATAARATGTVVVADPPSDPVLAARDRRAADGLIDLIRSSGARAVVNACGRVVGSDDELADANVAFPAWLVEVLAGQGVRLVHVGSASELGDPGTAAPVDESYPCRPSGAYAETKHAGTRTVLAAAGGDLEVVVARVFNLVGSDVPTSSPIAQWLDDLTALPPGGGTVEVWWPDTVRDFVRLDDAAVALVELASMGSGEIEGVPELVNVCCGVGLAYGAIVEALARRLGVAAHIVSLGRPGIPAVVGDPGRLRSCLGWAPVMDTDRLAATVLPAAVLESDAPDS